MPLTPLPASNTKRYFVGVLADTLQHHIQIRVADSVSDASAITDLGGVFSVILPQLYSSTSFNELLVANHGSDIRNPVAGWTTLVGTGAFTQPDTERPLTFCARGRAVSGRKVRLFLWGLNIARTANWEYVPGAGTDLATFLQDLNLSANYFLAIDGSKPVWKGDFTIDYNDHWEQEARP